MRPVWVGKRQSNRTACLLKAQLFVEEGAALSDAQILDLSATGARVKIEADAVLPEIFQIHIPSRLETRHCKLRWQRDGLIGVEFFKSTEVAAHQTMNALTMRVAALEARLADGAPAPAAAAAAVPAGPDLGALEERLAQLERDQQHTGNIVQDLAADTMADATSARFDAIEEKNAEILQTLRMLLPLLMRQAA